MTSLEELNELDDQELNDRWKLEGDNARKAFHIMGKLIYVSSQRMNNEQLRNWKSELDLSKGSKYRAYITKRFIELFIASEKISEERFNNITWQVIEVIKKLIKDWNKEPSSDIDMAEDLSRG